MGYRMGEFLERVRASIIRVRTQISSLKAFFDSLPHVPCSFFGEGQGEDLGRSMFSFSTMYAILAVMVVVLPVPAPARISWGAWVCLMASSWRDFKVERRGSKEINTTI